MSGQLLHSVPGLVAGVGFALAAWLWLRATRALREGTPLERLLDGFLTLSWLGVAAFTLLAGLSLYNRWTYHLPRAVFWIQSESFRVPDFPDAWAYYRWFPAGGDILHSWLILPLRSDLLLAPFGFFVWLLLVAASDIPEVRAGLLRRGGPALAGAPAARPAGAVLSARRGIALAVGYDGGLAR